MSIDEMIAVLQAAKEGERIQYWRASPEPSCSRFGHELAGKWVDIELGYTGYDFYRCQYRVAPKPREIWAEPNSWHNVHHAYNSAADFKKRFPDIEPRCFREVIGGEK